MRHVYHFELARISAATATNLLREPARMFPRAAPADRSGDGSYSATLKLDLGLVEIGREVVVDIGEVKLDHGIAIVPLRWRASDHQGLFPVMDATLEVIALSDDLPECQISVIGRYQPPMGLLGSLGDAVAGQKIAQAVVTEFTTQVASRLTELAAAPIPT